ncbi:MAG TPA: hypothetical protein PLN54_07135 [Flavobacteriales bacterium]|nr:hypothetical protein [Flavobacteriales bacterium]
MDELDPLLTTRNNFQHQGRTPSPVSHPMPGKFSFGPDLHLERTIEPGLEQVKGSNIHPYEGVINDRS